MNTEPHRTPPASGTARSWGVVALLCCVAFVQYAGGLGNPLLWDSESHILGDPEIRSLGNIPSFFMEPSARPVDHYSVHPYYRPVVRTLYALQYRAFGTEPVGYNVVSALLNALAIALTFVLVQTASRDRKLAFIATLLCAVHPARSVTIYWVACQSTLVMAVCTLGALIAYLRARLVVSVVAFLVGLFSREDIVLLPICLVLLETLLPTATGRRRFLKTVPYFVALAVFLLFRYAMVGSPPLVGQSIGLLVNGGALATARFMRMLILPDLGIAVYPKVPLLTLSAEILVSYGVVIASVIGLWFLRGRHPALTFWLTWVVLWVSIAAYAGLIGNYIIGANWIYVASTGFCVALAMLLLKLRWGAPVISVLVVTSFIVTFLSAQYFRDPVTFFERSVAFSPSFPEFHYELANALSDRGDHQGAIQHAKEVIRLKPDHGSAHNTLGSELSMIGSKDEAIRAFRQALEIDSTDGRAHYNLGVMLADQGLLADAERHQRDAIRLLPELEQARLALGVLLLRASRGHEGIEHFETVLRRNPVSFEAHMGVAMARNLMGQANLALRHLSAAARLRPGDANVHNELGITLAKLGRYDEAIREFAESLRLDPNQPGVAENRAQAERLKAQQR